MNRPSRLQTCERYPIQRSPLSQNPSQRDVARLVGETRNDLRTLATPRYKEQFLVRRPISTNGKNRNLVYPLEGCAQYMRDSSSISRR